jgi:regulatory protein
MKQLLRLISKLVKKSKMINNKEIEADPYSFALTTAHYALAPRAKSRAELHAHLKKRGVDELELQGLLNDLEFAQIWSESRQRQKKLSKRSIAQELKFKGVSQDIIDETLENIDDEDEYKMAFTLAERKYRSCSHLDHDVVYRRVHGLLSRKGFSHSISGRIMRELLGSNDR